MFGALQQGKSYRQLWRRSATRSPAAGSGAASLILGSDLTDETALLTAGDSLVVFSLGDANDSKLARVQGEARFNAPPPQGFGWSVRFDVNGSVWGFDLTHTEHGALNYPFTIRLDDLADDITGLSGATIGFALEFIEDPADGGGADPVTAVLPSVYIDQVLVPETAADLLLANRNPAPAQVAVSTALPHITFAVIDTTGTGLDLSETTITVAGQVAYAAGAFVGDWAGTVSAGEGANGTATVFVLDTPPAMLPFTSEQVISVQVQTETTGGGAALAEVYEFTVADTIAPALQSAVMLGKKVLRVRFTDNVLLSAAANGALNTANFMVVRMSTPAVALQVIDARAVAGDTRAVDLVFDIEASPGARYTLFAKELVDDGGNIISTEGRLIGFAGYVPARPPGRRFELLDFIPRHNLAADLTAAQGGDPTAPGTGDLRKFVLCLQDVIDILLCYVDRWTEIIDIDLAPAQFIDAILQDLGNPFSQCIEGLSENEKRRLARILISIYKQKGTAPGVINAIRFFTGVEVTIDTINMHPFWQLDISLLGTDTWLAPAVGSPLWYSWFIVSPLVLTQDQRDRMLCIARYMKPAHEHVLGIIEPDDLVLPTPYWQLDISLLGANTAEHPSTILA